MKVRLECSNGNNWEIEVEASSDREAVGIAFLRMPRGFTKTDSIRNVPEIKTFVDGKLYLASDR